MKKDIHQNWFFSQSPQEIWEFLTEPALLEKWLMKNDFKPVVGHKFQFKFDSEPQIPYKGVVDCEVLEVKQFSKLTYSWTGYRKDGRSFNSKVVWTLIANDDGTELQLQHNGFTLLEDVQMHTGGWQGLVKKMGAELNLISK